MRRSKRAPPPSAPRPPPDFSRMPKSVRSNIYWYKFLYAVANALFIWLLASIPNSWLKGEGGIPTVVVVLVFEWAAYLMIQGSDPGYLNPDLAAAALVGGGSASSPALLTNPETGVELTDVTADMESGVGAGVGGGSDSTSVGGGAGAGAGGGGGAGAAAADDDDDADALRLEAERAPLDPAQFCQRCQFDQPIRAKHCRDCDRCVAKYDHHCGVLGTCIGERNHCRFLVFLVAQTITLAVGISIAHSGFEYRKHDWWSYNAYAFTAALLLWLTQLFVFPLACWHAWLALTNGTSREFVKVDKLWYLHGYKECDLPFSRGASRNISTFCCVSDGVCSNLTNKAWRPTRYAVPGPYNRDSDDVVENCWENKYWSCC